MPQTFSIKQLQGSITINPTSTTPTFSGSSSNKITFGGPGNSAIKMKVEIHNADGLDGTVDMAIAGLPLSIMNQLSTFGTQLNTLPRNLIDVLAGDDSGLASIYSGSILTSIIDFSQPDAIMRITANAAAAYSAGVGDVASYQGSTSVAVAMQAIATSMGLTFENHGVTDQLSNSYLYGSYRDQYNTLREHANISATIDRGVLAIWPKFKSRANPPITLSPTDGTMIGYPSYTANGISIRALFNSSFSIGQQVTIKGSQLPPANATWNVYGINHTLESQTVGGAWESVLLATAANAPVPIK